MGLPSNATGGDKLAQLHRNNPVRQSVLAAPSQTVEKDIENNIVRRSHRAFVSECTTVTLFPSCFTQTLAAKHSAATVLGLGIDAAISRFNEKKLRHRYRELLSVEAKALQSCEI
jgi:hypothetical protein